MVIKKFLRYSILLFLLFWSNVATSNNDVYFIDMDFLMNKSLAGKSIIKKLDKKTKASKKNFEEKEKNLVNEEKKIISQKNILNEQEYVKKVNLFKIKVDEYKLSRNKIISDISKMKKNAQVTLVNSLTPILSDYAAKNSISYIIPKKNIIIGKTELDLTNKILEILDSKIKNIDLK
tara:strand:+ start:217 stop:747 length:531 start_codon:yes stop_codon:yes gene_type:complete